DWLDIPKWSYGVYPDIKDMEFNSETTFYRYGEQPSIITAIFDNNSSIEIYIGNQQKIFAVLKDPNNKIIKSKTDARKVKIPNVSIMPQVAPFLKNEFILTPEYIRRALSSSLAPYHFRNQLYVYNDLFPAFKTMVSETWSGLMIKELNKNG